MNSNSNLLPSQVWGDCSADAGSIHSTWGSSGGAISVISEETANEIARMLDEIRGSINYIADYKDNNNKKEEVMEEVMTVKIDYKNKSFIDYEAKLGEEIEYMVEDTKLTVEREILDTKRALKAAEAALADLKTEYPLNIERIVDMTEEIENHKKYLKVVEGLKKELF